MLLSLRSNLPALVEGSLYLGRWVSLKLACTHSPHPMLSQPMLHFNFMYDGLDIKFISFIITLPSSNNPYHVDFPCVVRDVIEILGDIYRMWIATRSAKLMPGKVFSSFGWWKKAKRNWKKPQRNRQKALDLMCCTMDWNDWNVFDYKKQKEIQIEA